MKAERVNASQFNFKLKWAISGALHRRLCANGRNIKTKLAETSGAAAAIKREKKNAL